MNSKVNGWLLLDKPEGISSAKALAEVKRLVKARKAGHAGTLDPMASGLLLIALGEACKFLPLLDFEVKVYAFDLVWGRATASDDGEGQITNTTDNIPDQETIAAHIDAFPARYNQRPPNFSALKIGGKRAYALARAGEDVELKPRCVRLTNFRLERHTTTPSPCSRLSVALGKGGYVRALARDLALDCGSLGHAQHIRRHAIGKLSVTDAIPLASLRKNSDTGECSGQEKVLDLSSVLDGIPAVEVSDTQKQRLMLGQSIPIDDFWSSGSEPCAVVREHLFLLTHHQKVFGTGTIRGSHIKPHRLCAT